MCQCVIGKTHRIDGSIDLNPKDAMAVDVDAGNDTAGNRYLLPTTRKADARHILIQAGEDGTERQTIGRNGGGIGGGGLAGFICGSGGGIVLRGVVLIDGGILVIRPISISHGLFAKEGGLIVDAQDGQIERNGHPLHRTAEHDGRQRLASPNVGAVPHDVGIGDDAIARDEETGSRRGGLSSGPPRFGIVGLHALNNELYILCVHLVERKGGETTSMDK